MTRIRQFAKDMGITYNKAKNLVQKGKKLRDGGSTILEKFTMPIVIKEKKKKKKEPKGGGPLMTPGQKKFLDKQTGKGKPEEAKSGKFMKAADGKITKLRKETSPKAKMGNFRNIVNAATSGKMSPEKAEKAIRKIVASKKDGGSMRKPRMGEKSMRKQTSESKAIRKFLTQIDMIPINIRKSLGVKKKDGGATEFGMLSVKAGIDNNPKPTQADRIAGATKGKKKMMGGGAMNMMPRRMMKKGGIARGGGAATSGTGFKGVY